MKTSSQSDVSDEFQVGTPIAIAAQTATATPPTPAKKVFAPIGLPKPNIIPDTQAEITKAREEAAIAPQAPMPTNLKELFALATKLDNEPPIKGNRKLEMARLARLKAVKHRMFEAQQIGPVVHMAPGHSITRTPQRRLAQLAAAI